MTKAQLTYILTAFDESLDKITPLTEFFSVVMSKQEIFYPDINRWRFIFNSDGTFSVIPVRVYAHGYTLAADALAVIDAKGIKDISDVNSVPDKNGTYNIYLYLTDANGHVVKDTFAYSYIIDLVPRPNSAISDWKVAIS